jgi:GAF domain-containing protein
VRSSSQEDPSRDTGGPNRASSERTHLAQAVRSPPTRTERPDEPLTVQTRVDDEFTGEERQLLQGMASVLGLALRSLRTLQTERALRTEREREAAERLRLLDTLGLSQSGSLLRCAPEIASDASAGTSSSSWSRTCMT